MKIKSNNSVWNTKNIIRSNVIFGDDDGIFYSVPHIKWAGLAITSIISEDFIQDALVEARIC